MIGNLIALTLTILLSQLPKIIVIVIAYLIFKKKAWPYIKTLLNDVHTLAEEARKKEP